MATTDGGRSWVTVYHGSGDLLDAVAFADQQHGWAVGWGMALRTTDGGVTWSTIKMFDHTLLFTVASINSQQRLGRRPGRHLGLERRWCELATRLRGNRIYSLSFSDPAHGWAVGSTDPGGGPDNVPGLVLTYGAN